MCKNVGIRVENLMNKFLFIIQGILETSKNVKRQKVKQWETKKGSFL